jgi:hypothetical protein
MLETMDEEAVADFFSKALFVIVAGSNDILEFLSPSVPFLGREKPDDPSHFQDALVSNLTFYLKVLRTSYHYQLSQPQSQLNASIC